MMDYIMSKFKTKAQNEPNSALPLRVSSAKGLAHSLPFDILEEIFLFVPYQYCQNIWIASSILQIALAPKLKRLHEYQEWLLAQIAALNKKLETSDEEIGKLNEKLATSDEDHKREIGELNEKLTKLSASNKEQADKIAELIASKKEQEDKIAALNDKLNPTKEVHQNESPN